MCLFVCCARFNSHTTHTVHTIHKTILDIFITLVVIFLVRLKERTQNIPEPSKKKMLWNCSGIGVGRWNWTEAIRMIYRFVGLYHAFVHGENIVKENGFNGARKVNDGNWCDSKYWEITSDSSRMRLVYGHATNMHTAKWRCNNSLGAKWKGGKWKLEEWTRKKKLCGKSDLQTR